MVGGCRSCFCRSRGRRWRLHNTEPPTETSTPAGELFHVLHLLDGSFPGLPHLHQSGERRATSSALSVLLPKSCSTNAALYSFCMSFTRIIP